MALRATKPNEDAPQPRRAKASALSRMGLRPTNRDENKGGVGGSACPERAREAERIAPGAELLFNGESILPGAERSLSLTFVDRVFRSGNERRGRHPSDEVCGPGSKADILSLR
jgi:hypothetical protein